MNMWTLQSTLTVAGFAVTFVLWLATYKVAKRDKKCEETELAKKKKEEAQEKWVEAIANGMKAMLLYHIRTMCHEAIAAKEITEENYRSLTEMKDAARGLKCNGVLAKLLNAVEGLPIVEK
jgi:hypothetical protein